MKRELKWLCLMVGAGVAVSHGADVLRLEEGPAVLLRMSDTGSAELASDDGARTALAVTQRGAGDILNLFDGSSEVLTVVDGGNVGIGTATPGERLTVAGVIETTGGVKFSDGTTLSSASQAGGGGGSAADRVNVVAALFHTASSTIGVKALMNGFVDRFEDESGIDPAASSGQTHDPNSNAYRNGLPPARLTVGHNYPWPGQDHVADPMAQAFRVSSGLPIVKVRIYTVPSPGWGTASIRIETDNGSGTGPSGTLADPDGVVGGPGGNLPGDGFASPTVGATYWLRVTGGNTNAAASIDRTSGHGHGGVFVGGSHHPTICMGFEIHQGYLSGAPQAMTLTSQARTALTQPSEAQLVVLAGVDGALNTDLRASASRDDGATWTGVTLAEVGAFDSTLRLYMGSGDLSTSPAGTRMRWRIQTTAQSVEVHGVGLQWR